ncbi:MAG TPA: methyltransferase [Rhizomicrobium sp.]|jgi:tRNA1(Val) A37 N6-methylase TrmN6|nr:methyltransferase [Rhizomicrobium sp.]
MKDSLLDGRVRLDQGEGGLRAGLDAVVLAAAVPAAAGQTALELGLGTGAASLCLAARVPGVSLTGVEIDPPCAALARANAAANGVTLDAVAADIFHLPPELKRGFDQVYCNPPFHGPGQASPDAVRAGAMQDGGRLTDWLRLGLQRTVSGGYFTIILRADRLAEALSALPPRGLAVFPLWPHAGEPARRVIVQVRQGSAAPMALLAGLVLHKANGGWTQAADNVLRGGAPLALQEARL